VLGVGDSVTDDTLKEGLKDTTGLFVNHCFISINANPCTENMAIELTGRDTLDTATTSETTDSRLSDTLDIVTKNLAVTLGTTLSKTFAALAAYSDGMSLTCSTEVISERKEGAMNGCGCGCDRGGG
jgi:hypothetical protein